jgi:hypothetical protein
MDKQSVIPVPTLGRIVHYVGLDGKTYAAIVCKNPPAYDEMKPHLSVFYPGGVVTLHDVSYASEESNSPGTWHWMAYQLGQAQYTADKART